MKMEIKHWLIFALLLAALGFIVLTGFIVQWTLIQDLDTYYKWVPLQILGAFVLAVLGYFLWMELRLQKELRAQGNVYTKPEGATKE
jgi:membrane protein implicated in regulation of membrane protease activity